MVFWMPDSFIRQAKEEESREASGKRLSRGRLDHIAYVQSKVDKITPVLLF